MDGDRCQQKGCTGTIQDGYCDLCGHAPLKPRATTQNVFNGSSVTAEAGSSPLSRAANGSRRASHVSSHSTRKQLGAGLIALPELPGADPEKAIMPEANVPERKRFCPGCGVALRREAGFCGKCGQKYSFVPALKPGDLVAGQYEVKGAIAYGGLGWIYLGFDKILSRYVVLKGLLNAHDESSAAAALAERQFLASVKHPNIVGIYNFVQNATEGYIVMEYVGGKTLKQIRQERGPLPAAESIAYIHRILPAIGYLHQAGLTYCDFKPDNMMLEKDDIKLIDMGGVRRIDDMNGDIYGTAGYSAPEIGEGPTIASDLYTVGRSLAVLLMEIHGFSSEHRHTLPSPAEEPLFATQESLYRLLLKATAHNPSDRFESAEQMADQLLGVLREVVSLETGAPRPGPSLFFGGDPLALESGGEMEPVEPDYHYLPMPLLHSSDPRRPAVNDEDADLRTAATLTETGQYEEAARILKKLGEEDPWDWRVLWYSGRLNLARQNAPEAVRNFDQVYFDLPGELAPKLALGLASELAGNLDVAIKMYDLVSRTDPFYIAAAFGLARCLWTKGERGAAVAALNRVPQSSALYTRSRIGAARILAGQNHAAPACADLAEASALAESLGLEGMNAHRLHAQILDAALDVLYIGQAKPDPALTIFGHPFERKRLRACLERSLRRMAQFVTGEERIELIDEANQVRPRTLF